MIDAMRRGLVVLFVMLSSFVAHAEGVPVEQATKEQKEAAQTAYLAGREAYDGRQFVDALAAFRESYGVVASPNTHLMIAHTLRELGRNAGLAGWCAQATAAATAPPSRAPRTTPAISPAPV
jgi:hypothetical protein